MRADGYVIGVDGASVVLGKPGPDLTAWEPGNTDAALAAMSAMGPNVREGLQQAVNAGGASTITITESRYKALAAALAEARAAGADQDGVEDYLTDVLEDPSWAERVATTETTQATSLGAAHTFDRGGVEYVKWLTDPYSNVCPTCQANEDQGAIRSGVRFSSGHQFPPAHPRCACAVVPANAPNIHPGVRVTP